MPRIEDPRPPGVSRTSTIAEYPSVFGAVDGVVDVLLRHGVDVVVEVDGEDARRGRACLRSRRRRERADGERDDQKPPQGAA